MNVCRRIAVVLALACGLAVPGASMARTDSTSAEVELLGSGGTTFSEVILDADNLARAKTLASGVGAEGRVGALSGNTASAFASWTDIWSSSSTAGSLFVSGLNVTGTFSPALNAAINTAGSRYGIRYFLSFEYHLGNASVDINIDYDGSLSSPIRAQWNPSPDPSASVVNLVPQITWGTNAAGDTTFALNVTGAPPAAMTGCSAPCQISESMSLQLVVEDFGAGYGGTHPSGVIASDFLHTFLVDVKAEDPNAIWLSEGGRVIGAVPEPGTTALMGLGLAVFGASAVGRRRNAAARRRS